METWPSPAASDRQRTRGSTTPVEAPRGLRGGVVATVLPEGCRVTGSISSRQVVLKSARACIWVSVTGGKSVVSVRFGGLAFWKACCMAVNAATQAVSVDRAGLVGLIGSNALSGAALRVSSGFGHWRKTPAVAGAARPIRRNGKAYMMYRFFTFMVSLLSLFQLRRVSPAECLTWITVVICRSPSRVPS